MSAKQPHRLRAALWRALLGFPAGALLGSIVFTFYAQRQPWMHATTFGAVALSSAFAGALFGAVAGGYEIRGKARDSIQGGLAGTMGGIVLGSVLGKPIYPELPAAGVIVGAMVGALMGALAGRIQHGGRVSIAEIMVAIALLAISLGVVSALLHSG